MPCIAPRLAALMIALAALATGGCRSGAPAPVIEHLDIQDLPAPAMFQEVATKLRRPYLLELPAERENVRFDLVLDKVTVEEALHAIVKLDPAYQSGTRGAALLLWPARKEALAASPFSKKLEGFRASGGAGEVIRLILVEAGLADSTNLFVETSGLRRPVKIEMPSGTARDALIDVAVQAHLGFMVAPGMVDVVAVDQ